MNRKTLIVVGVVVLLVLTFFIYLFLNKSDTDIPTESFPRDCLIFQSDDSQKPCYQTPSVPVVPNKPVDKPIIQYPTDTTTASSTVAIPETCIDSGSTFERNDCVTKTAVSSKNTQFCTLVVGSLAQSACMRDVGYPVTLMAPTSNQSYEAFLRSTNVTTTVLPQSGTSSTVSQIIPSFSVSQTDPRFTTQGLTERFKGAPLVLFGISPYQVRPGDMVTLQGTGFNDANDIHVSGYLFSTSSIDGFTLSFPAPATPGDYDVWVTNSKGSSQVPGRTMRLTVTTNPAPLPVITSITPNPAKYSDTIVISGTGFSNINTVSTSLGLMENVASSGGVISLRLSDLSLASQIKEIEYLKDRKVAILMYIQSDGGLSKDAYSFDVQF